MKDEVRRFLETPRELLEEIRSLNLRRRTDEELATKITPSYNGIPGGGYQTGPKDSWTRLAEYDSELRETIDRRWAAIKKVSDFIDRIPDPTQRIILRYRYINCLTWPEVEAAMSKGKYAIGLRQITRIHGAALASARRIWEQDKEENSDDT